MQFSSIFGITLTASLASAMPVDTTTGQVVSTENNLAARDTCILSTWSGNNCDGDEGSAWSFVVDGCRTCENVLANQHSIKLEGNCGQGSFRIGANADSCNTLFQYSDVSFNGAGCYNINTGGSFASVAPCFGTNFWY
ncbi:hypothetical protein BX600DRAFT_510406 [Xylariales sp. PMI_506]|nr:hypothetical protein BX600DRAFT_510406 [Xylariales sp. PMI_506]